MIVKNGTNSKIEKFKTTLKIHGDVYVVDNRIASLESHKRLFPDSTAATIEEAEAEFIAYQEAEKQRMAAEAAAAAAEERERAGAELPDGVN